MERENIKTHMAERTLNLPEEIIEQILSRLPVKSLLKFRCVSKSWHCLIGSKRFIKTHLENSTKNTTLAHHRIIVTYNNRVELKQCSLRSLLNEQSTDSSAFDDPINMPSKSICLVGCCNGLVCVLMQNKYFYLWNPSMRMSKKLPDIDVNTFPRLITSYGFGFNEWNEDYKVFVCVNDNITKVYSLKTNSWKITKNTVFRRFLGAGKFAGGKLHWSRESEKIVYFDLKSEVYGIVEQPRYSKVYFSQWLGVLGGCLSLVRDYGVACGYGKTHLDVWVMKQYGVKESWNKVAIVPYVRDPRGSPSLHPFDIGPNGEILLTYGSIFVIYYPKENVIRCPHQVTNLDLIDGADVYIDSLVSPFPDGEQERQPSW